MYVCSTVSALNVSLQTCLKFTFWHQQVCFRFFINKAPIVGNTLTCESAVCAIAWNTPQPAMQMR